MSANSRLKATKITDQGKAFYRQRISEPNCVRKETDDSFILVTVDILVTYRNGDRKIKQSIRIKSRPPSRKRKWNQLSQFNIYQRNNYRKDLSWPHFNDEPRIQGKQQVKDQQSCTFVSVYSLSSNSK